MPKRTSSKRSNKKKISLILLSVALVFLATAALELTGVTDFYKHDKAPSDSDSSSINYQPPTENEKQSGDKQKDKVVEDEAARNNPETQNKQKVSVIITDAGQYDDIVEVRSFIPDHYQDGACTITFTQGTRKVTKDTPAYRDASTTICTNPLFARSEFPSSGDWQVVVSYNAGSFQGSSEPRTVNLR